ncbi:hypothetical protein, partial [Acidisoma cellulosilyticum]|uniref:hypothetical protein n=1 Tax=Acidisoma cellulosilyticum TaxID=2802395 RepID=UPI001D0A889C
VQQLIWDRRRFPSGHLGASFLADFDQGSKMGIDDYLSQVMFVLSRPRVPGITRNAHQIQGNVMFDDKSSLVVLPRVAIPRRLVHFICS